jgi:hypothetical protein
MIMDSYYINQHKRLIAITNRKRATKTLMGNGQGGYTKATIETNEVIHEANLLYSQASTAGGWEILRHEIANFLYRSE